MRMVYTCLQAVLWSAVSFLPLNPLTICQSSSSKPLANGFGHWLNSHALIALSHSSQSMKSKNMHYYRNGISKTLTSSAISTTHSNKHGHGPCHSLTKAHSSQSPAESSLAATQLGHPGRTRPLELDQLRLTSRWLPPCGHPICENNFREWVFKVLGEVSSFFLFLKYGL